MCYDYLIAGATYYNRHLERDGDYLECTQPQVFLDFYMCVSWYFSVLCFDPTLKQHQHIDE